jgi:Flp pilus assembly protein CpaB
MKRSITTVAVLLTIVLGAGVLAAQTTTATKPDIFAQKLVDEALTKHPEVIIIAMHVTPPGKTENVIIASNIGRYGKKADEDDMRVIDTGKNNLELNKAGNHFEVEFAMKDQSDATIGAAGVVFSYKPGDDKAQMEKVANQIRDEWKVQTPNKESLFAPSK